MIYELLAEGSRNARTGRELAGLLHTDIRTVTAQIERERRDGQPICANMNGADAGYYLASDPGELQRYCDRLNHRGTELLKTRDALLAVLEQQQGGEAPEGTK